MAFINQGRHVGTVGLQDPETLTIVGNEVDPVGSVTITPDGNFKIHTYTTTGVFEVTGSRPIRMDIMSVGGGGSAGGGGGGAGGMVEATQITLEPAVYDVIIGAGGSSGVGAAVRGGDTVFRIQGDSNTNVGVPDAFGGGSGSIIGPNGAGSGGSGSGSGGQGVSGQGHNGGSPGGGSGGCSGATGGGGGAGSAGTNAGAIGGCAPCGGCKGGGPGGSGGHGRENDYRTGTNEGYAGGGAGGGVNLRPQAPDGSSIPGFGGGGSAVGNTNGVQNKGGGGARQGIPRFPGNGFGGSGIVVIRAPFPARDGI
jgi:hypothetical protein